MVTHTELTPGKGFEIFLQQPRLKDCQNLCNMNFQTSDIQPDIMTLESLQPHA